MKSDALMDGHLISLRSTENAQVAVCLQLMGKRLVGVFILRFVARHADIVDVMDRANVCISERSASLVI